MYVSIFNFRRRKATFRCCVISTHPHAPAARAHHLPQCDAQKRLFTQQKMDKGELDALHHLWSAYMPPNRAAVVCGDLDAKKTQVCNNRSRSTICTPRQIDIQHSSTRLLVRAKYLVRLFAHAGITLGQVQCKRQAARLIVRAGFATL